MKAKSKQRMTRGIIYFLIATFVLSAITPLFGLF